MHAISFLPRQALLAAAASGALFGAAAQPLPSVALEPVWPKLKLACPVALEEIPDDSGRYLIAERSGRVWLVEEDTDGGDASLFLDLSDRWPVPPSNGEGLLGLCCHPKFKQNGHFYLCATRQNPRRVVLSEISVRRKPPHQADPGAERVLLEILLPPCAPAGGRICFGPDGFLYLAVGDRPAADTTSSGAQDPTCLRGKILRLDVDTRSGALPYGIPPDNPFAGRDTGARKEIFARGLRDVGGMSWDRQTGDLWGGIRGREWEGVALIRKGGNYGWPFRDGFHRRASAPAGTRCSPLLVEAPHTPALAGKALFPGHGLGARIVGGHVYRGQEQRGLRGLYLYADGALGTLFGLRYGDGRVLQYGILLEQPRPILGFAQDSYGELYVLMPGAPVMRLRQAK